MTLYLDAIGSWAGQRCDGDLFRSFHASSMIRMLGSLCCNRSYPVAHQDIEMGDADQLFEFLDRDDSGSLSIVEPLDGLCLCIAREFKESANH